MSEAYFELRLFFRDEQCRDLAVDFINGDGPAFEEEVEDQYKDLFRTCEQIDLPDEMEPLENSGLLAAFELFGSEALIMAENYLDQCSAQGIIEAFAIFADDEDNVTAWAISRDSQKVIYQRDHDSNLDDELVGLDHREQLSKLIDLFDSGKLTF